MEVFQTDEDEWIVESLQRYESLYMFELQYPTRCMEWTRNGAAVSVAGFSSEYPNEIIQLSLPEKLLPPDKQTLWAKRDFKLINGVIIKSPVTCIKYVNQSDLLLSSGCDPAVTMWAADVHKSDLLVQVGEMELKLSSSLKQALSSSSKDHSTLMDVSSNSLLLGSSVSPRSLQMVDVESKKILFNMSASHDVPHSQLAGDLHGVKFVSEDDSLFVSCNGERGGIVIWDRREPPAKQKTVSSPSEQYSTDVSASNSSLPAQTSHEDCSFDIAVSNTSYPLSKLAVLGSNGRLVLYDGRRMDKPCAACQCADVGSGGAATGFRGRFSKSVRQPCVEFCQQSNCSNLLSVSGVMKGVQIYDYSQWSCDMPAPSPLFVHRGHEQESPDASILVHSWQPGVEGGTVFSCDNEGSLHAWQWKETTLQAS